MPPVATTPIGQAATSRFPKITEQTREEMRALEQRLARNPELNRALPPINSDKKYVFRCDVIRGVEHCLDMRPEGLDEGNPKHKFALTRWDFNHRHEDPAHRALVVDVYQALGGISLSFKKLNKKFACFYDTDDDRVAEYVRHLIKTNHAEFAKVYEQDPRIRLVAGDKAFPNTSMGQQNAMRYALEHGYSVQPVPEGE